MRTLIRDIFNFTIHLSGNFGKKIACKALKVINTKKGEEMGFLTISDDTGSIEATVFPKTFAISKNDLVIGKMCIAECSVIYRDEKTKIIIQKMIGKK